MRKVVIVFLFTVIAFGSRGQKPDLLFTDKIAFNKSSQFIKNATFIESKNHGLTDFVYQRMEWEIDPNVVYIKGVVTTYYVNKTQNLTKVEFDLDSSFTIDSVTYRNDKLDFSKNDNTLIIVLQNSLSEGILDSLSIHYQGMPNQSGFGSFSQTFHKNIPNIWTLSEPYGAMEWWPCKQSLIDKIDSIDIIVTSPETYRTASNGTLISETIKNGKRKMHWKHRHPIATYLIAISVTNYADYSDFLDIGNEKQIEIQNFVYPEDIDNTKSLTPVTAEIMSLFNNLIGEYPYADEKYGHAQFGWGGGMEHQTISFMGNFSFGLISHELAHQWFGDYITLGTWQDIWLNEGFATYLTGLSIEHLQNDFWPLWKKDRVERITNEPDGSVFVQDTTDIGTLFSSRLSYSKGAYLLHMLRWILGDEDFFSGIKNYYNDPEIANNFAYTHQFIAHMENVADTALTEFFDDWYYGEGFPVYRARYWLSESDEVKIALSQTPSHSSIDFFEMPVPVRVYNSDKTDSADFRLIHTKNDQEFIINPGFRVSEIKVDPDYWLVSKTEEVVQVPFVSDTEEIMTYPNPSSDIVHIHIPNDETINQLNIYTLAGKRVKQISTHTSKFNINDLTQGKYILEIYTTKRNVVKTIIKL